MNLRAVVIDDEELGRAHLCKMLRDAEVDVVAEGENGIDALNLSESHNPDIVFLDIQMPDMTGMQAAAALENFDRPPRVAFVTGYSEYAIGAFELHAFDYLIKPVAPERLEKTLDRTRKSMEAGKEPSIQDSSPTDAHAIAPLSRLPIRTDYSIKLLRFEEIDYAVSRDKKVYVRASGTEHRTYYSLLQLEGLLPPAEFMRLHLSALVRLSCIESVNFLGNHTYSITLSGGTVLPVGRTFYPALQARLGI